MAQDLRGWIKTSKDGSKTSWMSQDHQDGGNNTFTTVLLEAAREEGEESLDQQSWADTLVLSHHSDDYTTLSSSLPPAHCAAVTA